MKKGIIYIMKTAVTGIIKIGQTETNRFEKRMRELESNGYHNITGLQRTLAIEVDDYQDKEKLLHEIFNKHQVGDSELFALDIDLIQQLLLSLEGKVIYPQKINKEKEFEKTTKRRVKGDLFSLYKKGIRKGDILTFKADSSIRVKVVGDREVMYQGIIYKLSPLALKLYTERGNVRKSGSYQGANHFCFHKILLTELPDK